MSDLFDPVPDRARRFAGIVCVPAAILFGLITLVLVAGMTRDEQRVEQDGMPLWVGALVCGLLAVASAVMAVRAWTDPTAPAATGTEALTVTPTDSPGPHFRLVVLNDSTHSYDYVIRLFMREFGMSAEKGFAFAQAIDQTGRAVVFIGDAAEVQDRMSRILAAGPDPLLRISTGPLQVLVEEVVPA